MAVSGTTTFTRNRDEAITDALIEIGGVAIGGTPTTNQITHASNRLNTILKAWQGERMWLYSQTTGTKDTVASTDNVAFIDGMRRVLHAYITSDNVDIRLNKITQDEYDQFVLKTSEKIPTSYYVDEPAQKIYLYPVPDSVYTITFRYETILDDLTSAAHDFALPQPALDLIIKALAYELSIPYGLPADRVQMAEGRYRIAKAAYLAHYNQEYNATDIKQPLGVNII